MTASIRLIGKPSFCIECEKPFREGERAVLKVTGRQGPEATLTYIHEKCPA